MENKTNAKCQVRNKATKTKLTNMLRGKERKGKKEYICKVRGRWRFIYTLKINCKKKKIKINARGKRTVGRQRKE